VLVKSIYILELFFTIFFCYSSVSVNWTSYTYSFFHFLLFRLFLFFFSFLFYFLIVLELPNFVNVTNSCGKLVFCLNKWILILKLNLGCNILTLWLIQPRIIYFLSFIHQSFNSINRLIINWLIVNRRFTYCLIVENISFLIFLTFINKDLPFIFFYF
jgi:hypothetical protein